MRLAAYMERYKIHTYVYLRIHICMPIQIQQQSLQPADGLSGQLVVPVCLFLRSFSTNAKGVCLHVRMQKSRGNSFEKRIV